ncbi:MAG: PHP domain-containing protein [Candidatus Bathyarchaeota archaeon]|nr:PHP domain-containing protein [Candidatus Bathyarchaeota archaeon]
MIIDLHIHSRNSDGKLAVNGIVKEAKSRNIMFMSITDHDSISCQKEFLQLATAEGIRCISGVELNVTFSHPQYREGKEVNLDFLGYNFDVENKELTRKLQTIAEYREQRAQKILNNLNVEFQKEGIEKLTAADFAAIQESIDGVLARPHIADYLVKKGIVKTRQEAFDKYLVKCDVQKFPLYLPEASKLVRDAGGKLILAHPNDPHGTSLVSLTKSLDEQTAIIENSMLDYIDGVECWHTRHDALSTEHYTNFAKKHHLLMTGGSDCHQKPIVMGTVNIPPFVAGQFFLNKGQL